MVYALQENISISWWWIGYAFWCNYWVDILVKNNIKDDDQKFWVYKILGLLASVGGKP